MKNIDLEESNISEDFASKIKISDFTFMNVTDKRIQDQMVLFIEKHEWLGNITMYSTHWFACYYNNTLAGVIIMSVPNMFSKMLGEETKDLERLISRGACISWSPKGLASAFMMWSIRWMVVNTPFRLFSAYSDPMAKELGTIYQACNFYYIGNTSGATTRYINPYTGKVVSDRFFRHRTAYKRYAVELGIEWEKDWVGSSGIIWENIPDDIEQKLRERSKQVQKSATPVKIPSKHKYVYILGVDKRETKKLKKLFEERNKTYSYPKERGK